MPTAGDDQGVKKSRRGSNCHSNAEPVKKFRLAFFTTHMGVVPQILHAQNRGFFLFEKKFTTKPAPPHPMQAPLLHRKRKKLESDYDP